MTIIQMLVTGMILIIIATMTLAVLSYGAFKIRERNAPKKMGQPDAGATMFFERVRISSAPPTSPVRRDE